MSWYPSCINTFRVRPMSIIHIGCILYIGTYFYLQATLSGNEYISFAVLLKAIQKPPSIYRPCPNDCILHVRKEINP